MRLAWLVPAGLSATGLLIGVLAATRGRNTLLGRTARKGPRTGAIEVDDWDVEMRVRQLLEQFDRCTNADGKRGLQPMQEGSASQLKVRDAETGEERLVYVLLRPKKFKQPWIRGEGTAISTVERGRVTQEIHIKPNAGSCESREAWTPFLTQVLAHEAAHASDPAIMHALRTRRGNSNKADADQNYVAYINSPNETAAQLVEVEKDLRQSMRTQPKLWRNSTPVEILRLSSDRYVELERKLTPKNRRRYLRLAARLVEDEAQWRQMDKAFAPPR